jgi:hypothetical protein
MDDGQRPKKNVDDGSAVAERIFGDVRATGRLASPRHFEFWFTYKTGRCTELNAAADEIIARNGDISSAEIEALSDRFLSAWRRSDGGWDQSRTDWPGSSRNSRALLTKRWIPVRRSAGFLRQEPAT